MTVISPYANECIHEHKMEKRVEFITGDFMKDEIPGENDLALLFNIIHGFGEEDNQLLFNKVYTHLNPKGQLVILDQINQIAGKSQFARATTSFMGLNLFHQANGNTYSFDQVKNWAGEAGFKSVTMSKLHGPGFGIITCIK